MTRNQLNQVLANRISALSTPIFRALFRVKPQISRAPRRTTLRVERLEARELLAANPLVSASLGDFNPSAQIAEFIRNSESVDLSQLQSDSVGTLCDAFCEDDAPTDTRLVSRSVETSYHSSAGPYALNSAFGGADSTDVSYANSDAKFDVVLTDGRLQVVGSEGNDVVEIRQSETTITVVVKDATSSDAATSQSFQLSKVASIVCDLQGGDDSITLDVAIGVEDASTSVQSILVRGGAGDDSFVDLRGGAQLYGELGNDYFDTRNGRWNFVDGGEGANVHKRDSFDVGTAISYTNPFEESDTNKPIVVKVMVMAFDPVVESEGGKRLHEVFQWRNPVYNVMAYKEAMERVSGGFVTFEITHWTDFNEFPYFLDGYQYTPEEYVANRRSGSGWHEGAGDVCRAMTEAGVPALVDAGEVDEVWWVGEHYVPGGGEAFMVGPGAFFINGATFPDLDVDRPIAVVGMSYERELYCEMEDMSHRSENHIGRSYNHRWNLANPSSSWDYFGANITQSTATPGVGSCHYAPNSEGDYDWYNPTYVETTADDWLNYPNMTGATAIMNAENWNETHHHQWWFEHFPRASGTGPDGRQANWWKYLYDFNNYESGSGAPKDFRVLATHADSIYELGADSYTFTVTYSSPNYVDISSLALSSVTVSHGEWRANAALVKLSDAQDDPLVVATYTITPPGGVWDADDLGVYRINLAGDVVADCSGATLSGQTVGVFDVRSSLDPSELELDDHTSFLLRADGATTDETGVSTTSGAPVTYESGLIGQGLRLGADALTYPVNEVANASEGTIEFWFKPDVARVGDVARETWVFAELGLRFNSGILVQVDGANNYRAIFWGDNQTTATVERSVESGVGVSANSWRAGEWLHFATTWDASGNQSLYLNGQLVASNSAGSVLSDFASNAQFTIGRQGNVPKGIIDEFRISTVARTAGEIARDYEVGRGATSLASAPPIFPPTPYVNVYAADAPSSDPSGVLPIDADTTFMLRANNSTVAATGQSARYGVDVDYDYGYAGSALALTHNSFLAYDQPGAINAEEGTIEFLWRSELDESGSFAPYFGDVIRVGFQENDNRNFIRFRVEAGGNIAALFYGDNPSTSELELTSESIPYTSGAFLKDGQFHYIAITWKQGDEVALYVDGVKASSRANASTPSYFGQDSIIALGGRENTASGALDEFRISSRARTAAEIQAISERNDTTPSERVWLVTTTEDSASVSGSLRYALARASDGDVVRFADSLNGQRITLASGPLVVGKSVTIDASSLANGLTIDADGKSRVFTVHSAVGKSTVELKGLTITGGSTSGSEVGGGVYNQGENLTLTDCVVVGNASSSYGGGVYNSGTITIVGGSIADNEVRADTWNTGGGGMYSVGYATLSGVELSNNRAEGINDAQGGGVYARGSFVATDCKFTGNKTLGQYSVWGGGLFIYDESEATISDSVFTSNVSEHTVESWNVRGGAICSRGITTIEGCEFTGNSLIGQHAYGGAIDNYDGTLTVKGSTFENNTTGEKSSSAGGAILSRYGSLTLEGNTFKQNTSQGYGGAVLVERAGHEDELFFKSIDCYYEGNQSLNGAGGAVHVDSMTTTVQGGEFVGNSCRDWGGGIRQVRGSITVENVVFTGNTSGNEGGALQTHESEIEITSSSFTGNTSQGFGGAVRLYRTPFAITDATFSDNSGNSEGGALKTDECTTATIKSSVFSGNSALNVGGAVMIWRSGAVVIEDVDFTENTSSSHGGALYVTVGENETATFTDVQALGNKSGANGGAFFLNNSGQASLQDVEFVSNEASWYGGAVYTSSGVTDMTRVTATSNVARGNDGGAFTLNGTNTIVDSQFISNSGFNGGAIRNDGELTIRSSVLANNAAIDNGGGIYHCNHSLKVVDSSIVNNTVLVAASGSGGAIEAYAPLEIVNSTLAGNQVTQRGGAIWFNNEFKLVNTTIAHNLAGEGGGIWQESNVLTAVNTIVASNHARNYADVRATNATGSRYNVIGAGDNFGGLTNGADGNQLGTSAEPLDAYLGPITQDAEGRYFVPLASFSPAVDAGLSSSEIPTVDALGHARYDASQPNAGSGTPKYVDVGAYEYTGANPEGVVDYTQRNGGKYHSLAVDSHNNAYATDMEFGVVRVFDGSGRETRIVGEWGEGAGRLVSPRGVAIGENDALYVLSSEGVVQVFDATGAYQKSLLENAGFVDPQGLCFDLATKRLYVADSGNNRVLCVSPTGERLWSVGGGAAKSDHTGFDYPTSVAIHPQTGEVWIADYNNDRIEIYNAQGQYVGSKDAISKPTSIAFDAQGNLFYATNANPIGGKLYYEGRIGVLRDGQTYGGPYFFGGLDDLGRVTQGVATRANGDVIFSDPLNRRVVQTTPSLTKTTGPSSFDAFSVPLDNLDIDANGTSATFTWTTRVAVPTYVKIGSSASSLELVGANTTKTKSHSITVSDLTPQTTMYYQVGYPDSFTGEIRWSEAERFNTGVEVGQKQILRLKTMVIVYTDKNFSSEGYERAPESEMEAALESLQKTCQYIYQATRFNVWMDVTDVLYYDLDLAGDDIPKWDEFAREKGYTVEDDFDILCCYRLGGGGGVGGSGVFLDRWIGGIWTTWGDGFNVHELDHAFDFALYGDFAKYRDCHSTWQIVDSEGVEDGVHNAAIYGSLLDASYAAHFGSFTKLVVAPDADDDGVPDDSPTDQGLVNPLPITEKTLGSSPSKKDTDGDGLSDFQEATLFIYGGSDPTKADCNRNGVRDGDDLNPVYVMNGEVQHFTPTLDGKINEEEWSQVIDHYAYPSEYYLRSNGETDVFELYSSWDEEYLYLGFKTDGAHWLNVRVDGGCDNIMIGQDTVTLNFHSGSSTLSSVSGGLYNFDVNDICEKLSGVGAWINDGTYIKDLQNAIYTKEDIVYTHTYNRAFDIHECEIAIPWKNEITGFNPYNRKVMGLALYVDNNYVFNAGGYGKIRLNKTYDLEFDLSSASVAENKASGTFVGTFEPNDAALDGEPTYSLVASTESVNQEYFTIEGNQLKLVKALDYESQPYSRVCVRADFGENGVVEKLFEITTLDVAEPIEITFSGYSGVYDKSSHGVTVTGVKSGDAVRFSVDGANWSASAPEFIDAGSYTVYAQVERATFDPWSGSAVVNITPRGVKVSIVNVDAKEFDGTRSATGSYKLEGVLSGDTVTLSGGAFEFANANAGENKTVSFKNYTLEGSRNYQASNSSATWSQGVVTPRRVDVEWRVEDEYVYTGAAQDSSVVAGFMNVQNRWQNVDVAFTGRGTEFLNAGEYTATASYDSINYELTNHLTKNLTISPATIAMTFTPNAKTYDGTRNATYACSFTGVLGDDEVALASANCVFDNKNVGANKSVTISNCVLNNANYALSSSTQTVQGGVITARTLLYSGGKVNDKTWDGGVDATFVEGAVVNAIAGDDLQVVATCAFPDSAPNQYRVPVTFKLSGADVLNYKTLSPQTYSAKIKPGVALTAEVYDVSAGVDVFVKAEASGAEDAKFAWSFDSERMAETNSEIWIMSGTGNIAVGDYALTVRAEYNGVQSDPDVATLRVRPIAPSIAVDVNEFMGGRALRIALNRFEFGGFTRFRQTIDWGDGVQTEIHGVTSNATVAHYYQEWDATREYDVTLNLYKPGSEEPETFLLYTRRPGEEPEISAALNEAGGARYCEPVASLFVPTHDTLQLADATFQARACENVLLEESDSTTATTLRFSKAIKERRALKETTNEILDLAVAELYRDEIEIELEF